MSDEKITLSQTMAPSFTVKADNLLSLKLMMAFVKLCEDNGCNGEAARARGAVQEFERWQADNARFVRMPE